MDCAAEAVGLLNVGGVRKSGVPGHVSSTAHSPYRAQPATQSAKSQKSVRWSRSDKAAAARFSLTLRAMIEHPLKQTAED